MRTVAVDAVTIVEFTRTRLESSFLQSNHKAICTWKFYKFG